MRSVPAALFFAVIALPAAVVGAQQGDGARRALLIGINDYQVRQKLGGCRNDVDAIQHVLTTRFGFTAENCRKLFDGEATRDGILRALEALVEKSGENDVVYVHFSGHGAYVRDLNDDEEDGLDETICPVDSLTDGVADIVDDEIDAILRRLRTPHAVVVFDSCHSGTATRNASAAVQSRGGKADDRIELYRHLATQQRGDGNPRRFVFLGATKDRQTALDGPIDNVRRGFFSKALTDALARSSPEVSLLDFWRHVGREYARVHLKAAPDKEQRTPRIEFPAGREKTPLFPAVSERGPRRPYLTAKGSGRTILLLGGAPRGANIGSVWAVYPRDEQRFAPGAALAVGMVVRHRRDDSVLRLKRVPKKRDSFDGARAILVAPALARLGVPVKIHARAEQRDAVARALVRRVPNARVVESVPENPARFVVEFRGGTFQLLTGDEQSVIVSERGEEAEDAIATALAQSVLGSELASLENPASLMGLNVSLAGHDELHRQADDVANRGVVEVVAENASAPEYRVYDREDGMRNTVALKVEAEQDCYLTVVGLDQAGRIQLVFPTENSERFEYLPGGLVQAYSEVELPKWGARADGSRAPLRWGMDSAGYQHYQVFATADLETAERIRTAIRTIDEAQQSGFAEIDSVRQQLATLRTELLGSAIGDAGERGVVEVVEDEGEPTRPDEIEADAGLEVAESDENFFDLDTDFTTEAFDADSTDTGKLSTVGDWTVAGVSVRVIAR